MQAPCVIFRHKDYYIFRTSTPSKYGVRYKDTTPYTIERIGSHTWSLIGPNGLLFECKTFEEAIEDVKATMLSFIYLENLDLF